LTPALLALLLGIRHATGPDHLTAVSTLVLTDREDGVRRAGAMGLAWGVGHAITLCAMGVPVILLSRALPHGLERGAEAAAGLIIVVLALRLLDRWRRGYFHWHPHSHDGTRHSHPHFHETTPAADHPERHGHDHLDELPRGVRSITASLGVGLVHGAAGSAGASVLAVALAPGAGAAALALFAAAVALAMAGSALALGWLITREPVSRTLPRLVPVLGAAGVVVGALYAGIALRP
jgi:ABC-type nickel/cobalt efflux system permease component RcnA